LSGFVVIQSIWLIPIRQYADDHTTNKNLKTMQQVTPRSDNSLKVSGGSAAKPRKR
jgi:hypothetical protein